MMEAIILTVGLIAGIGLVAGLILSFASEKFAVEENQTAKEIEEVLPGANCGSCGFAGCSGYASALAEGKIENTALCSPGGTEVAQRIAAIMGAEGSEFVKKTAVVLCGGSWDKAEQTMNYSGMPSCLAANQFFAGLSSCSYGCIGFGDCAAACEHDAIVVENGLAKVIAEKCVACGKCVSACPKGIIRLVPAQKAAAVVKCCNTDKGAQTRKDCKAGCIGCGICKKNCPADAIKIENFKAEIDYDKCTACGKCEEVCPQKCISVG
jgi:electron transport complex protein RnfB